ncbi:MAG: glycosyltransferase [Chloroflexi bacterium]|uniref:MGDG synthase family glycosyltransferase n=1 Tax=Candidatus Flexifilum breve TaxID=3140694 RepID=UPI0031374F92|nr:glycosyltransferase [Chloroflexota bacterium]
MPKRVLFIMSDTGGGHRAAAEAIRDALIAKYGDEVQCQMVDGFRHYSPFPFKYMPEFYPWLINHSKSSWGVGYKLSNTRRRAKVAAQAIYLTAEKRLKRMLREYPADVVVSVHSVLTHLAMQAMMSQEKRPPFVVVVTDLVSTHMFWYDRRADRTLVPTLPALERGLEAGIKAEQMRITGLPVHPQFEKKLLDKAVARQQLGWDANLPAILMVGGGEGMGPLYKVARAINSRKLKCQLIIIAGRNKTLKEKLEESDWNQPVKVYGFVTDMPKLMAAADILVTKAGPATISEAAIAGLPLILFDAIPGQEEGNVDFVVENKAGEYAPTPKQVADAAQQWLSEGAAGLKRRSDAARSIAKPNAVWEIAEEIWEYAHKPAITTNRRNILKDVVERSKLLNSLQSLTD